MIILFAVSCQSLMLFYLLILFYFISLIIFIPLSDTHQPTCFACKGVIKHSFIHSLNHSCSHDRTYYVHHHDHACNQQCRNCGSWGTNRKRKQACWSSKWSHYNDDTGISLIYYMLEIINKIINFNAYVAWLSKCLCLYLSDFIS